MLNKIFNNNPTKEPKVTLKNKALKGYLKSFEIEVFSNDPLTQLNETKAAMINTLNEQLKEFNGIKYVLSIKIMLKKQKGNAFIYKPVYFNNAALTVINEHDIVSSINESLEIIEHKISVWMNEGSGWTIVSVDNMYTNLSKCKLLRGSSYIELPITAMTALDGVIYVVKIQ